MLRKEFKCNAIERESGDMVCPDREGVTGIIGDPCKRHGCSEIYCYCKEN